MEQKEAYRSFRARSTDWAVLYLRLFLGGVILLYNIGNIQNYNEIIDSYPPLLFLGDAVSFGLVTVVEVSAALLLMIGFRVRFAAGAVALGLLVALVYALPAENMDRVGLLFVLFGQALALVVSGGGYFALEGVELSDFSKRKNQ